MKQRKHITEVVTLGEGANEVRLTLESTEGEGEDSEPATVVIDGWEVTLQPEEIERVADALRCRRFARGDYRVVCADHGYHESSGHGCPKCPDPQTLRAMAAAEGNA